MSLTDEQWCPSSVQVTVLQARGLRIKGKSGTNDAYAVMQVGKEKYQTSVAEKSVAPVWKEEASFDLPPVLLQGGGGKERSTLHVHVLHRALVGPDKLLGQAVINLLQLSEDKTRNKTEWFKLLDKTGKLDKDRGEVLLDIQFMRNNMTASMFDLSTAGKSRSRLGKFKDKVRGKKKELDSSSGVVPNLTQVLTDSEEEDTIGGAEGGLGKAGKSKPHKRISLFSPKSNLQKNMSQSMSVLPTKNSSLTGSQSSGLNVDSSEGKKKFKFKMHKHSSSSDSKHSSSDLQKEEQSKLCINGSHVYCEEPPPRTSRIRPSLSLSSSGRGSMEDVPENSFKSVDSLEAVREHSPWMEGDEEDKNIENLRKGEEEKAKLKDIREEEEAIRKQQKELERLAEEKEEKVREEEKQQRVTEAKCRIEKEESRRREEEERAQERRRLEERKLAEEERKLKERESRMEEEGVKRERERAEEERRKKEQEEKRQREEKEMLKEKMRIEEEEKNARLIVEKRREEERIEAEEKRSKIEEKIKSNEHEEKLVLMKELEEKERREAQEKMRGETERKRKEETERLRIHEELERLAKLRQEEEERKAEEEKVKREEEERIQKEKTRREEEERKKTEEEERKRRQAELEKLRQEEEKIKEEEERVKKEEQERIQKEKMRRAEEDGKKKEEEERKRRQAELEKLRQEEEKIKEEEERVKKEEQERIQKEKMRQEEEKRKKEEEWKRRQEELKMLAKEKLIQEEEEKRKAEELIKREEEERNQKEKMRREEEERKKKEEEDIKRRKVELEKLRQEEEEKRKVEEERIKREEEKERIQKEKMRQEEKTKKKMEDEMREEIRKEEDERIKKEEQEKIRMEEEKRKTAEEKRMKEEDLEKKRPEEERMREEKERMEEEERKQEKLEKEKEEKKITEGSAGTKLKMRVPAEIASTNPFDEKFGTPEEVPNSSKEKTDKRCQSAVSSVKSCPVSTNEKDLINTQREKRAAPKPPGRNQPERQRQEGEETSVQHLSQINKQSKDKDVKTVSVAPQRSVLMIPPLNRSSKDLKNTQSITEQDSTKEVTTKHNKRAAPSIPCTAEEKLHRGVREIKEGRTGHSLNPFDEDDDEENALTVHDDPIFVKNEPVCWPPITSQTTDKDAKVKSSKIARAPLPPAPNDTLSSSIMGQNHDERDASDDIRADAPNKACKTQEVKNDVQVQETPNKGSKQILAVAGMKEEGPHASSRRLQPVKPLNPLEQQSDSVVKVGNDKATGLDCNGVLHKTNVGTGRSGPYSQLTREELIALLLKQESQLSERDKKISELEKYIDNLLVRVIEESPSILMSMNSLKKAT